jgi:hypothetical protein
VREKTSNSGECGWPGEITEKQDGGAHGMKDIRGSQIFRAVTEPKRAHVAEHCSNSENMNFN